MEIKKEKQTFQPVTITLTSQEELDVLVAALNASQKTLKDSWEQVRFGSVDKINQRVAESMFWKVAEFYKKENK